MDKTEEVISSCSEFFCGRKKSIYQIKGSGKHSHCFGLIRVLARLQEEPDADSSGAGGVGAGPNALFGAGPGGLDPLSVSLPHHLPNSSLGGHGGHHHGDRDRHPQRPSSSYPRAHTPTAHSSHSNSSGRYGRHGGGNGSHRGGGNSHHPYPLTPTFSSHTESDDPHDHLSAGIPQRPHSTPPVGGGHHFHHSQYAAVGLGLPPPMPLSLHSPIPRHPVHPLVQSAPLYKEYWADGDGCIAQFKINNSSTLTNKAQNNEVSFSFRISEVVSGIVTIRSLRDSTKRKYDLGFANHARAFWHSPATLQFMYTDSEGFRFSVQFRNLEWMRPVRAGDMLIVRHQMYTEHREPLKFYEPALRLYFVFDGKNWLNSKKSELVNDTDTVPTSTVSSRSSSNYKIIPGPIVIDPRRPPRGMSPHHADPMSQLTTPTTHTTVLQPNAINGGVTRVYAANNSLPPLPPPSASSSVSASSVNTRKRKSPPLPSPSSSSMHHGMGASDGMGGVCDNGGLPRYHKKSKGALEEENQKLLWMVEKLSVQTRQLDVDLESERRRASMLATEVHSLRAQLHDAERRVKLQEQEQEQLLHRLASASPPPQQPQRGPSPGVGVGGNNGGGRRRSRDMNVEMPSPPSMPQRSRGSSGGGDGYVPPLADDSGSAEDTSESVPFTEACVRRAFPSDYESRPNDFVFQILSILDVVRNAKNVVSIRYRYFQKSNSNTGIDFRKAIFRYNRRTKTYRMDTSPEALGKNQSGRFFPSVPWDDQQPSRSKSPGIGRPMRPPAITHLNRSVSQGTPVGPRGVGPLGDPLGPIMPLHDGDRRGGAPPHRGGGKVPLKHETFPRDGSVKREPNKQDRDSKPFFPPAGLPSPFDSHHLGDPTDAGPRRSRGHSPFPPPFGSGVRGGDGPSPPSSQHGGQQLHGRITPPRNEGPLRSSGRRSRSTSRGRSFSLSSQLAGGGGGPMNSPPTHHPMFNPPSASHMRDRTSSISSFGGGPGHFGAGSFATPMNRPPSVSISSTSGGGLPPMRSRGMGSTGHGGSVGSPPASPSMRAAFTSASSSSTPASPFGEPAECEDLFSFLPPMINNDEPMSAGGVGMTNSSSVPGADPTQTGPSSALSITPPGSSTGGRGGGGGGDHRRGDSPNRESLPGDEEMSGRDAHSHGSGAQERNRQQHTQEREPDNDIDIDGMDTSQDENASTLNVDHNNGSSMRRGGDDGGDEKGHHDDRRSPERSKSASQHRETGGGDEARDRSLSSSVGGN